jgi:signal transduction histidine kinase
MSMSRKKFLHVSGWSLRRKLALVLAFPIVFAVAAGSVFVTTQWIATRDHKAAASQVSVLPAAVTYLDAAENAAVVARRKTAAVDPKRDAAVGDVDKAASEFEAAANAADLTAAQEKQVASILYLSRQLRTNEGYLSVGQSVSQVRQLHQGITQLISEIVNEQAQPEPKLPLLTQTLDGRLALAMQQFQVAYAQGSTANPVDVSAEIGVEGAAIDRLGASLGLDDERVMTLNQGNAQRFGEIRAGGLDMGGSEAYKPYDALSADLLSDIDSDLTAATWQARISTISTAVVTGLCLLVAVLIALMISRSMLRQIRTVRDGAIQVANEELPKTVDRIRAGETPGEITPIDVTTEEEMGQLARAFDDLHRQAITLASGEAELRSQVGEMFATLSRRNTTLINQQLGLIEDLEQDEEDPRRLESLFRLDHLASRMRRTAESLMVLADAPTPGADGVDLSFADLLQAAIAGVRDYQRVQILSTPDGSLASGAAPDVVHLLTELVDNALNYSPPTAPVMVDAVHTAYGVEIEIADAGLGMAISDLAKINAQLTSGGQVNSETARRMGLLVVSRLARRRGIQVRLELNDRGGVTAHVAIPQALLPGSTSTVETPDPVATPAPAPVATDDEPVAVAAPAPASSPRPAPMASALAPANAPTPSEDQSTTRYLAAIDALTRLPQRQPSRVSEPVAVAPAPEPEPVAVEPEPVAVEPEPEPVAVEPEPEPVALTVVPEPVAVAVVPEPVAVDPEPVPVAIVPEPEPQHEPLQEPMPAGGEIGTEESPIFATLQSNWFSSSTTPRQGWASTEVEAGWEAAHRVTEAPSNAVGAGGLPVRRPGQRLVPGGVTAAAPPVVRDPEAIRARLAAHAAGVSRARTSLSTEPADPTQKDADPA